MNVEQNIEVALFTRAALLTVVVANAIKWPNRSFTPPADGSAYIEVRHLPSSNTRYALDGANPFNRQGRLQITVYAPKNKGPDAATQMASEIAAHFPADLSLWSESVRVKVTQSDLMSGTETDVAWEVPVLVSYEASA